MTRRYRYNRMTPEQFSEALNALGYTMGQFVRVSGYNNAKVQRFLTGEEDIPHQVAIMCSLLTLPGAKELARTVADAMVQPDEVDHVR